MPYGGKKKKRIMRKLRIDEISGVDEPAQAGARVMLMKRYTPDTKPDPDPHPNPEPNPMLKKAVPLRIPVAEFHKTLAEALDLEEIKKRRVATVLTSESEGHQHGVTIQQYDDEVQLYLDYAQIEGAEYSHDHAIARNADGTYTIATNVGHSHTLDQEALGRAMLSLVAKSQVQPGGNPMKTAEELSKELKAAQQELATAKSAEATAKQAETTATENLADMTKKYERVLKVLALSGDERAFFDTISATDFAKQDAFLDKDFEGRGEIIKKADEANPVVFTSADGEEFRKNDDPRLVAQARKLDAVTKDNEDMAKSRENDRFEKRAETELAHMPGELKTRVAILKALDGIEDEDVRKAAIESVQAKNDKLGKFFKNLGHDGDTPPEESQDDTPEGKLHKMAKDKAEKENIPFHKAYTEVANSPEGQALYKETTGSPAFSVQ